MLIDLAFLISTVRLFHSFIQYTQEKKIPWMILFLKERVLQQYSKLISNDNRSPDINRGSLRVNDVQFCEKMLTSILCQHLLAKECKPNLS